MPAKYCRKHNKSFFGPRCPSCTAIPTVVPQDDEELPFPGNSLGVFDRPSSLVPDIEQDAAVFDDPHDPDDPSPDTSPDFGGGDSGGGGASSDW